MQNGDSLWRIAEQNLGPGATYNQIQDYMRATASLNPSVAQHRGVWTGDVLTLPGTDQFRAAPINPNTHNLPTYTVQSGDSLWRIAEQNLGPGATYNDIQNYKNAVIAENPSIGLHHGVWTGDVLALPDAGQFRTPAPAVTSIGGPIYTVQNGDSLQRIAEQHLGQGATWTQINNYKDAVIAANSSIAAHHGVWTGDVLALPNTANILSANDF